MEQRAQGWARWWEQRCWTRGRAGTQAFWFRWEESAAKSRKMQAGVATRSALLADVPVAPWRHHLRHRVREKRHRGISTVGNKTTRGVAERHVDTAMRCVRVHVAKRVGRGVSRPACCMSEIRLAPRNGPEVNPIWGRFMQADCADILEDARIMQMACRPNVTSHSACHPRLPALPASVSTVHPRHLGLRFV